MKIERLFAENTSIANSVSAEKLLKEEKHVFSIDAVVLDSDKKEKNQTQEQSQQNTADKEKDPQKEAVTHLKEVKGIGKIIDVLA
jgi:hypothetical protein